MPMEQNASGTATEERIEAQPDNRAPEEYADDDFSDFEKARREYFESPAAKDGVFGGVREEEEVPDDDALVEEYLSKKESRDPKPVPHAREPEVEPVREAEPVVAQRQNEKQEQEQPKQSPEKQDKPPLMTLKVEGRDFPVYDYEALKALAQKGFHYTQSMQQLAPHRDVLVELGKHRDIQEELDRRRRGLPPSDLHASSGEAGQRQPAVDPAKAESTRQAVASMIGAEDIPPMKDDETHEEWVKRAFKAFAEKLPSYVEERAAAIAEEKAMQATTSKFDEVGEMQHKQRIMSTLKSDPLFEPTVAVIRHLAETGEISKRHLLAANEDEESFRLLYKDARNKVQAYLASQRAQVPPVAPASPQLPAYPQQPSNVVQFPGRARAPQQQAPQPRPQTVATTPPPPPAPYTEGAGTRVAPQTGKKKDFIEVMDEMNKSEFFGLLEKVKAGLVK